MVLREIDFRDCTAYPDNSRRLVRYSPAGHLGLCWQQRRASHQIRMASFRKPGLCTARVRFRDLDDKFYSGVGYKIHKELEVDFRSRVSIYNQTV